MQIAELLFVFIIIFISAKLLGELMHRIGQPSVLGELLAGVFLGGSVLGFLPIGEPDQVSLLQYFMEWVGNPGAFVWFQEHFIPRTTSAGHFLHLLGEIGVIILLFETGLATNLKEMKTVGAKSLMVALAGVVLPFAGGFLFCYFLKLDMISAIFVGAALTATSVGITVRVLADLGKKDSTEAKIILGAAVVDDIIGLIILSIMTDMAGGEKLEWLKITWIAVVAVVFFIMAIVIGILLAKPLIKLVEKMRVQGALIISAVSFAFLWALLAEQFGSAVIIGSFAAGLALSETHRYEFIREALRPLSEFFTPIFFVTVGAAINVFYFNPFNPENHWILMIGGSLLVIAIVGKALAGFAIFDKTTKKLTVGIGMVPRGEVGLIFAEVGRRTGLVSDALFAAVVVVMALTTFLAPPLLKIAMSVKPPEKGFLGWVFSPIRRGRRFLPW
ncbi:MAG: cation:proton antiporter [bacterium]|nr:cation:proton antiporter [bacterium]